MGTHTKSCLSKREQRKFSTLVNLREQRHNRMKLLSVALLAGSAMANLDKIRSVVRQLQKAAYDATIAANPAAADRGFTENFAELYLEDIVHYGCWCYLDANYTNAHGPVQDGLDMHCKNLVRAYRCIVIDSVEREDETTCDPVNQEYEEYNLFGGGAEATTNDVVTDCNNRNPGQPCETAICIADGTFSLNLFTVIMPTGVADFNSGPFDPNLAHASNAAIGENGATTTFDPDTECAFGAQGVGYSDRQCCGAYPQRYPFKTMNGDRACCADQTYNTLALQCCPDLGSGESIANINDNCPS